MRDYAQSYWLQNAIKTAEDRDIVDALNDAEFLVGYLRQRLELARRAR